MIAYVDSSFLVRSYLVDESDHAQFRAILGDPSITAITGSWTRVEVTGSIVRAARAHRGNEEALLALFREDTEGERAPLTLVDVMQADVELVALGIVRRTGIRSMDAWHVACASLALPALAEPGEELGFATRDAEQAAVASEFGYTVI